MECVAELLDWIARVDLMKWTVDGQTDTHTHTQHVAEVSGQNTVEGTKYESQPIMEILNKYRCLSVSFKCEVCTANSET